MRVGLTSDTCLWTGTWYDAWHIRDSWSMLCSWTALTSSARQAHWLMSLDICLWRGVNNNPCAFTSSSPTHRFRLLCTSSRLFACLSLPVTGLPTHVPLWDLPEFVLSLWVLHSLLEHSVICKTSGFTMALQIIYKNEIVLVLILPNLGNTKILPSLGRG